MIGPSSHVNVGNIGVKLRRNHGPHPITLHGIPRLDAPFSDRRVSITSGMLGDVYRQR